MRAEMHEGLVVDSRCNVVVVASVFIQALMGATSRRTAGILHRIILAFFFVVEIYIVCDN